jgi:hypothetical protein
VEIQDEDNASPVANDGTLPGGLSKEQSKKLTGNPEIMTLFQSTKMQEAMQRGARKEASRGSGATGNRDQA